MAQLQEDPETSLQLAYPIRQSGPAVEKLSTTIAAPAAPKVGVAKPKVVIPVFPGTNCEYDTARAFARAGADPEILVVRNLTPADVTASCEALVRAIGESQIVMLPGAASPAATSRTEAPSSLLPSSEPAGRRYRGSA